MIRQFVEWNRKNKIEVQANNELFFISERFVIRPDYILNNKIYVCLVTNDKLAPDFVHSYEKFSQSYGTLMVIPYKVINELKNFTKTQLEEHFNISF